MIEQLGLFQIMGWGHYQPINKYLVLLTLEKALGRSLNEHTEARLAGCATVEEVITRISQDDIEQVLHQTSAEGRARLGELYVALRVEGHLANVNQKGYDVYGVSEHSGELKAQKIQVKTAYSPNQNRWAFRLTNEKQETGYDVLVCVGLVDGLNPKDATIFVMPEIELRPIIEREIAKGKKGRIRIDIAKQRNYYKGLRLNRWYEYQVVDHTEIKRRITEYIHGIFVVLLNSEI